MSLITSGMVGNGGFAAYLAQYSFVYTNFRGLLGIALRASG